MITGTTIKRYREREKVRGGERGGEDAWLRLEVAHNKAVREREWERQ